MRSPDRPVTVTATVRPSRRSARRADGLSASGTATLPSAPIAASARPSSGEASPSLRARRAVTASVTATRAPAGPVTVAVVPRRASVPAARAAVGSATRSGDAAAVSRAISARAASSTPWSAANAPAASRADASRRAISAVSGAVSCSR